MVANKWVRVDGGETAVATGTAVRIGVTATDRPGGIGEVAKEKTV